MNEPQHPLKWRGRAYGPWTLPQIREALTTGEVHSLYQIQVDGHWLPLRDYLENLDAAELARRALELGESLRQREAKKVEPVQRSGRRLGFDSPISRPDPFGKPPPVFVKGSSGIPSADLTAVNASDLAPTCWLAVAAFVIACTCFLPYLNLVSWVPAIVLGHFALAQIRQQPLLEGRGLAMGAVIIGFSTLAFAILSALLAPALFHRVFLIGEA
jgi:hypothetical protein